MILYWIGLPTNSSLVNVFSNLYVVSSTLVNSQADSKSQLFVTEPIKYNFSSLGVLDGTLTINTSEYSPSLSFGLGGIAAQLSTVISNSEFPPFLQSMFYLIFLRQKVLFQQMPNHCLRLLYIQLNK